MLRWLGFVIIILVQHQNQAKRPYSIELNEYYMNVSDGGNLVKFANHKIHSKKSFTVEFAFLKSVSDLKLNMRLDMLKKDNKPINLFKVSINGCQGLIIQKITYVKMLLKQFLSVSNMPLKDCVFHANTVYYIRNYTINDDDYPPFWPTMTWKLTWQFIFDKKSTATNTLIGRVRKI